MNGGSECAGTGAGRGASVLRILAERVASGLSRPAADDGQAGRDRRLLHRLSVMSEGELRGVGLVPQDVHDARLRNIRHVAGFLVARREARRALKEQFRRR